jgi:hypothetical protein
MDKICSKTDCDNPQSGYKNSVYCKEHMAEMSARWRRRNEGRTYEGGNGYVKYVGFNHPIAASKGITYEHRIVLWDQLEGKDAYCHWGCGTFLYWDKKWPFDKDALIVDHINRVKNDNRPENLVPSCGSCNFKRQDMSHRTYKKKVTGKCQALDCDRDASCKSPKSKINVCGTHYNQEKAGREFTPIQTYYQHTITDYGKDCSTCKEMKPWEEYYKHSNNKGYQNECKDCVKARRIRNQEKRLTNG